MDGVPDEDGHSLGSWIENPKYTHPYFDVDTHPKLGEEKETPNSTTLSKKIAQGNLTASCKRLISWFLLYKGTELGRKIVPVRPPKF
ncbi:hypothetical protein TNCV_4337011 [Trichonephila clavipes]|nr:hypothetical protein TNCV_4337011 [Trichonephila clavipes]